MVMTDSSWACCHLVCKLVASTCLDCYKRLTLASVPLCQQRPTVLFQQADIGCCRTCTWASAVGSAETTNAVILGSYEKSMSSLTVLLYDYVRPYAGIGANGASLAEAQGVANSPSMSSVRYQQRNFASGLLPEQAQWAALGVAEQPGQLRAEGKV